MFQEENANCYLKVTSVGDWEPTVGLCKIGSHSDLDKSNFSGVVEVKA